MKQFLKKPLGLAVSVALALGALTASTTASAVATAAKDNSGDAAIVPYYTANAGFTTGLHIINTTGATQVVKIRLRRKLDSFDAIDFNIVMSPNDMFVGAVVNSAQGLAFRVNDNTCTVPAAENNLLFPVQKDGITNNVVSGANEGYIEVIGMGEAVDQPRISQISLNALHAGGVPSDCVKLQENFWPLSTTAANISTDAGGSRMGVIDNSTTATRSKVGGIWTETVNNFIDTPPQALKVSYFIRHQVTGLEFGGNAVHIQDFNSGGPQGVNAGAAGAMMTNQKFGLVNLADGGGAPVGSLSGYDFPNLDGGSTANGGANGFFSDLRALTALGTTTVLNDWSVNSANAVGTDWVVTFPGQYLMRPRLTSFANGDLWTTDDLPVQVTPAVYDREEGVPLPDGLVVSPGLSNTTVFDLKDEVNVIQWYQNNRTGDPLQAVRLADYPTVASVLSSASPYNVDDNPYDQAGFAPKKGWARLNLVDPTAANNLVYNFVTNVGAAPANNNIPTVGFSAWQRNLNVAGAAYGRIVDHTKR